MLPLGTKAPPFALANTDGAIIRSADYSGRPLLVMFICNHCPYVQHVAVELARMGREYRGRLDMVAINSNDPAAYPDDSPGMMRKERAARGYDFPYLFDETQEVARSYGAACTPDFFLFDRQHHLVYRGQLDASRPGNNIPVTGKDLRHAMNALLNGEEMSGEQLPSIGCNIKWRRS
jgi:peroxiredoxin